MGIEDTITYIDTQIQEVIGKIIQARTKHIDAINRILQKLNEIQQGASLTYRLGTTYDKMVKVENGTLQHYDVTKPTIKLNYTGSKTTLSYDTGSIDVPSMPVFHFETRNVPNDMAEINEKTLIQNLLVCFPLET